MGVDRVRDPFARNKDQALETAKIQLEFILDNVEHLRKVDKGSKMETAATDFEKQLKDGIPFTPGQYSYIDGIYEKT